jgi:hypothetical protein
MRSFCSKFLFGLFLLFGITSCLAPKQVQETVSGSAGWFDGVATVKNLGGYPAAIKITWPVANREVSAYRIYSLEYDPKTANNAWAVIEEVAPGVNSYVHSDLSAGQIYSYMVAAVDTDLVEDGNKKQLSTVAFDGISSARTTGTSTATVTLNTATGSFDEVRVYAQPSRVGGTKKLVATVKGNVDSINVTGLHSGVKYKFSVQAYMDYLSAEDGNEAYIEAQTNSDSFGGGGLYDTYSYRGVMAVQAVGDAPNAPAPPTARQVRITWPAFQGATSTMKYRVVRASTTSSLDATTTTTCTAATIKSCVVSCTNTGAGPQTCTDTNVGAPPLTYNYVITQIKKDNDTGEEWVEELPPLSPTDFQIKIPIPSNYMVLIQRDAANYEMCVQLGSSSDPRNHQRCIYGGLAQTPYNSGPGKAPLTFSSGYYDFGYNLFVDRFRVACNWTRNSPSCGPNGCIGITSTTANTAPDNALGADGDVFFALNPRWGYNCYYKNGTSWTIVGQLTDPVQLRKAITIDPGVDGDKHNPQMNGMDGAGAYNICHSQTSDYGNKRLMRRREHVHAAAFATLVGEPNAITDKVEENNLRTGAYNASLNQGGQLDGYYRCPQSPSSGNSNLLPIPATIADLLSPTNTRAQVPYVGTDPQIYNYMSNAYFIGTISTSNCVSRWGSQDPVASGRFDRNTVLSDSFIRTNDVNIYPATYAPVTSDYDSGVVYDWGTYVLDGITGMSQGSYATATDSVTNMTTTFAASFPRFILPMGLPINSASSTYRTMLDLIYNGALGSSGFGTGNDAVAGHAYNTYSTRFVMVEGQSHRFSYTIHPDGTTPRFGAWCAVEAE